MPAMVHMPGVFTLMFLRHTLHGAIHVVRVRLFRGMRNWLALHFLIVLVMLMILGGNHFSLA
jgi:hypothetical protein